MSSETQTPNQPTPVHFDVCLKATSVAAYAAVLDEVASAIENQSLLIKHGPISLSHFTSVASEVEFISADLPDEARGTGLQSYMIEPHVHVFQLDSEGMTHEEGEGEDAVSACAQWTLPSRELHGIWESLVLESGIKQRLLHSASTGLLFSAAGVDTNVIAWNRVVLLHGPPGTGKTSLCQALAQKLSIRLGHRFPAAQLLEINAHSLFSKWFSESGKLVQKLFDHIHELLEDSDTLVFVLIDEVESLTAARSSAAAGTEPSDAVRVVNALLTQIDRLRLKQNVLILTTSNVTSAIDAAFIDRADIKQFIGLPPPAARFQVLASCVDELARVGLLSGKCVWLPWSESQRLWLLAQQRLGAVAVASIGGAAAADTPGGLSDTPLPADVPSWLQQLTLSDVRTCLLESGVGPSDADESSLSVLLAAVAHAASGLSGRALRKLPFLAHASHVQVVGAVSHEVMLLALLQAALAEQQARGKLAQQSSTSMLDQ